VRLLYYRLIINDYKTKYYIKTKIIYINDELQ